MREPQPHIRALSRKVSKEIRRTVSLINGYGFRLVPRQRSSLFYEITQSSLLPSKSRFCIAPNSESPFGRCPNLPHRLAAMVANHFSAPVPTAITSRHAAPACIPLERGRRLRTLRPRRSRSAIRPMLRASRHLRTMSTECIFLKLETPGRYRGCAFCATTTPIKQRSQRGRPPLPISRDRIVPDTLLEVL